MSDKNDFDSLVPGNKKGKREKILEQLDELDNEELIPQNNIENNISSNFLPSSLSSKKKKKNQEPQKTEDDWYNDLIEMSELKIKAGKRKTMFDDVFNPDDKKKKKKKKNKNEPTDYEKKFEPEAALLKSLLIDQNKFVDSLQREYDFLKNNKSTSRGINKNITDLISNITNARNLSMQLIDKNTALKKTIADLTMKERKELFANQLGDAENLNDFASTYLKQIISERHQVMSATNSDISDYSTDEMASAITDALLNSDDLEERTDETRKYLEYENKNVKIYVFMNTSDESDYDYVAIDDEGEEVPDYPLPFKGKLTVNRSTNMATDVYGQKYIIKWR